MIHTFHLEGFEHRLPSSLSGGEKQKVALAGALAINPDIIISDEATSMLDGIERAEFMNNLKMLSTAAGKTVIMITHDINEASLADRIAILNHGKIKAYDTPEKIFNNISLLSENGLSIPPYVRLFHDLKMYGILSGKCPSTETAVVSMIINALASTAMIESKSISDDCATSETTGFINTENSNPAITLKDVSYIYDTSSDPVVKNVSITINSGEITGITGPAGSGKTTLIQIMAGIILPHSGSVITLENDTARTDTIHQIRNKTGFLFQYPEYQLFETTVFKDVAFSLKYSGLTKKEIKERVTNALLTVGLNPEIYSDKSPLSLSGGEKRKVALAGILVKQPQLIILDEPLAGLDAFARTELMILLKNLTRKGITIILVTHNSECLYEFSDRILIMTNGIISSDGKPSEICSKKISEREWFALPPYTKIGFMLSEKKLIPRKAYLSYNSLLKAILHTASCKSLLQQNIEEEKTSDSHK